MSIRRRFEQVGISSLPHFILVMGVLFSFAFLLHLLRLTVPVPGRSHTAAIFAFCGFVVAYLSNVTALIALGLRKRGTCLRTLTGVSAALQACVWKTAFFSAFAALMLFAVSVGANLLIPHSRASVSLVLLRVSNRTEALVFLVTAWTAGITEEFIFRGFVRRHFETLTGNTVAAALLPVAVFTVGHAYQGLPQLFPVASLGMLAHWRRSLVPGMIAHAFIDSLGPPLFLLQV